MNPIDQFRQEIHAIIRSYGHESDLTVYQILGALTMIEHDLVAMLDAAQKESP